MARLLNVFLNGASVGQLDQDDSDAIWFQYGNSWIASELAVPLSASLPVRSERFRRNECHSIFTDVLPEEESRKLIAKTFGISDKNDFALLERIGAEPASCSSRGLR